MIIPLTREKARCYTMNKMIIKGNLTADPKSYTSKNEQQTQLAKFAVAVRRPYQDGESDYFHCTAFGKRAGFIIERFAKGKPILIIGHMENDNFRNKNDEQVYGYNLIVDEVEFAGDKQEKNDPTAEPESNNSSSKNSTNNKSFNFLEDVMPFGVSYGE